MIIIHHTLDYQSCPSRFMELVSIHSLLLDTSIQCPWLTQADPTQDTLIHLHLSIQCLWLHLTNPRCQWSIPRARSPS